MDREEIVIMSSNPSDAVRSFVLKKAGELKHLKKIDARMWVLRIIKTWSGPTLWKEVKTNQRKMEIVYKCWTKKFFGYGLHEDPPHEVAIVFRAMVKREVDLMSERAQTARKKYEAKNPNSKVDEFFSDDDGWDYYNQESAKLWNVRTQNKQVAPHKQKHNTPRKPILKRKVITNPYMKKSARKKKTTARRVSYGEDRIKYMTPPEVYSTTQLTDDEDSYYDFSI